MDKSESPLICGWINVEISAQKRTKTTTKDFFSALAIFTSFLSRVIETFINKHITHKLHTFQRIFSEKKKASLEQN